MIQSYSGKYDRKKFIDAGIPFYPTFYPESDCCRSRLSTDPYPFEPVINTAFDGKGNLIPLELMIHGERKKTSQGIAVGAYGIASFRVPGKIFSELEVYAGIHPESKSDKTVTVGIWCYESNSPLLASGEVSLNSDALHFKVKLPEECRTVSLLSADGNNDTSVIWFDPELTYVQGN